LKLIQSVYNFDKIALLYSLFLFFERLTKSLSNQGTRFLVLTCIFFNGAAIIRQELIRAYIAHQRLLTSEKRSKLDIERTDKKICLSESIFLSLKHLELILEGLF
jgi:hypothetical protein